MERQKDKDMDWWRLHELTVVLMSICHLRWWSDYRDQHNTTSKRLCITVTLESGILKSSSCTTTGETFAGRTPDPVRHIGTGVPVRKGQSVIVNSVIRYNASPVSPLLMSFLTYAA
jgi:hypothetical protein